MIRRLPPPPAKQTSMLPLSRCRGINCSSQTLLRKVVTSYELSLAICKNPTPWGARFTDVVPPRFSSKGQLDSNAAALCGDNGPSRGSILSHRCDLRGPLPGGFPAHPVEGALSRRPRSLLDLSCAVLFPINAFLIEAELCHFYRICANRSIRHYASFIRYIFSRLVYCPPQRLRKSQRTHKVDAGASYRSRSGQYRVRGL
jgi:hypothetical protein